MKKILSYVGVIAFIVILISIVTKLLGDKVDKDIGSYIDVVSAVEEWKTKLPLEAGDGLTLYDITLEGKVVSNTYKVDKLKKNLTAEEIAEFENNWKKLIIKNTKGSIYNKNFLKEEIIIKYTLYDAEKEKLIDFSISPNDYK
ncbi:hypothetical protein [Elizabethkingia anophelis]|uniref:hypothetical protein n=1 Tax=Elizabethkingia anophelis TaxID=1117645 RepID=UPI000442ADA9|nr:hypothetical protein [Elizabethkingia anophelis]CDN74285.1 hypothetical protein E18064_290149 [Elizabethkingia anophelis]CDN78114.1 hypothetical protein E27107_280149 [Elizabethkingia anophelis]